MRKMDRMTPMAVGGALFAVFFSMIMDGSSPSLLFKPAPLILVFGGTFLAAAAGFALGKWFSGLGIAFALLFVVVVSVGMVGAQMGSYTLACDAHQNDILRHWTC